MRYVRIVCEGAKTEPNYFRGILKLYDWKGAQIVKAKDNSPVGIVRKAKEQFQRAVRARIPRDQIHVWAVFDRDSHANLKQALQEATAGHIRVAGCLLQCVLRILHFIALRAVHPPLRKLRGRY